MNIKSEIKVGNNATLGFDKIKIETSCVGFITLFLPLKDGSTLELELSRKELREFLARTCPAFSTIEKYDSQNTSTIS